MMEGDRPAVFLDRDGTLIEEAGFLADPEGVRLVPGTSAALRNLKGAGFAVVVVTNQSGIARGLYDEADYHAVAARITEALGAEDAEVDATYYCPHHPEVTGPCECRKPGLGMYRRAAEELGLVLERSYFVGDKLSDVAPAKALGGTGILVRTGYGPAAEEGVDPSVAVVDDVARAADWILARSEPG